MVYENQMVIKKKKEKTKKKNHQTSLETFRLCFTNEHSFVIMAYLIRSM